MLIFHAHAKLGVFRYEPKFQISPEGALFHIICSDLMDKNTNNENWKKKLRFCSTEISFEMIRKYFLVSFSLTEIMNHQRDSNGAYLYLLKMLL